MADKEFTQICKEILGIGKRLEKIEPDELRKIKADIEQISATIVAHKASFDASKEDFDGKYSGITEIINTFDTLKAQIEEVLKSGTSGTINDNAEALISTFSSKKIMDLLNEAKGVVDEKFSTIHKNGITPWSSSLNYPAGAISVLNGKLYQAKTQNTNKKPSENKEIWHVIANKEWCEQTFLNKDDKIDAYAKKESDKKFALKNDLPPLATEDSAGITKLKNSITAKQEDTAVTEKAIVEYINKDVAITGNATFSGTQHNIVLNGIGSITLAVGDVIEISGTTNNNKLFTVESIVGNDEIIVNYEHRGTSTPIPPKRLKNETSLCTIKLYNRAKNAPLGQGQGWCVPASGRGKNTKYTNSTGREIAVAIIFAAGGNGTMLETDGSISLYFYGNTTAYVPGFSIAGRESIYELRSSSGNISTWYELR